MFVHLLLGLLRDGQPHHGYRLMTEYEARSGNHASAGNFYRVLARLAAQGLVNTGTNPAADDERRIPYRITEAGAQVFDRWLVSSGSSEEIWERLLFADRVPREALTRLLDRWQEDLWMQGKALARRHDDALHDSTRHAPGVYNPLPVLLARRIKQVEADLEFLKGLRGQLEALMQQPRPEMQQARPEEIEAPQPIAQRSQARRGVRSR
jgi:DNA-binding PadR family transcriptional regulator